jgi:hypothetical protein
VGIIGVADPMMGDGMLGVIVGYGMLGVMTIACEALPTSAKKTCPDRCTWRIILPPALVAVWKVCLSNPENWSGLIPLVGVLVGILVEDKDNMQSPGWRPALDAALPGSTVTTIGSWPWMIEKFRPTETLGEARGS